MNTDAKELFSRTHRSNLCQKLWLLSFIKHIEKKLISEYCYNLLNSTNKSLSDALKTALKGAIQKVVEATSDIFGNKIAKKITRATSKTTQSYFKNYPWRYKQIDYACTNRQSSNKHTREDIKRKTLIYITTKFIFYVFVYILDVTPYEPFLLVKMDRWSLNNWLW